MSGICKHQSKLFIRLVCHSNNLSVAVRLGTSPSLNSEVDSNLQIGAGRSLTVTIGVEYEEEHCRLFRNVNRWRPCNQCGQASWLTDLSCLLKLAGYASMSQTPSDKVGWICPHLTHLIPWLYIYR